MNYEKMYNTIDTHVAGEAFRIVIQSPIRLNGEDIQENHDQLQNGFTNEKNLLLNEPRGHRGMHGCVVVPSRIADFSLLFFNHPEVSNFKYEGLFATVTALLETGNLNPSEDGVYHVETVNGIRTVKALLENQEVTSISTENDSCSVTESNPDYTAVRVDNDRDYLIFSLPDMIPGIELEHLAELNRWGLKKTTELTGKHIDYAGVVVIDRNPSSPAELRSVTFEKDGYIRRSPGVDSTFAILAALSGEEAELAEIGNHSVFDSALTAKRVTEGGTRFSVETEAFVTGSHEFVFDQDDPLKEGFLLV